MKIILVIVTFCSLGFVMAQDSLNIPRWKFVNEYRLSFYALSLFDGSPGSNWGGNEIHINLASYRWKRNELGISSGIFFINRVAQVPNNPNLLYFYFPINVNYKLYSKNNHTYWQFGMGTSMIMYEDTKFMKYDEFWPQYEDVISKPGNIERKRICGIHSVRFGYQIQKHFSVSIGEMSYLYLTRNPKPKHLTRLSFGIEYKL